jgi:uncharacterized protein (DUF1778 family)
MVARGGIEPPTRGFSSEEVRYGGLLIHHLQSLPTPIPGTSRHIPGTPSLSSTQLRHVPRKSIHYICPSLRVFIQYQSYPGANVKRMPTQTTKRKQDRLEVRLTAEAKALLKRAASVERKTVNAFVLDKGLAAAAETLGDRREFRLPAKQYDAFVAALDAPAKARPRLERLMKSPSVLE